MRAGVYACRASNVWACQFFVYVTVRAFGCVDVRCVGVRGVRVRISHMIYSVLLLLEPL